LATRNPTATKSRSVIRNVSLAPAPARVVRAPKATAHSGIVALALTALRALAPSAIAPIVTGALAEILVIKAAPAAPALWAKALHALAPSAIAPIVTGARAP
jgi:hypothetical protein